MIYFNCDYTEGAHPAIINKLMETNMEQTIGYGMDDYCKRAKELILNECQREDCDVHFLVGGTQTNVTVIDAALKPYQGVLCADTGHINVHETGAVEACGHKCIVLPSKNGKITAPQILNFVQDHFKDGGNEHMVQPKMVYISNPTELGTIYKKAELEEIYHVCKANHLYLFVDGARLGYGLMCDENDLSLADIAANSDVFYIGGTKVGALFGEAVVITNEELKADFRYNIKQHGAMLAKGRLLGIQFETLFENGLYYEIAKNGINHANRIREFLQKCGVEFYVDSPTNQLFIILNNQVIEELQKKYVVEYVEKIDEVRSVIRLCTSWATTEKNVDAFLNDFEKYYK